MTSLQDAVVAVVSPGGTTDFRAVATGERNLRKHVGPLRFLHAPQLGRRFGYLCGDDPERVAMLEWAFSHPEVTHVWVTRGGYGMSRIASRVPWRELARAGKILLGSSDATAIIHPFVAAGGRALHAPMIGTDISDGGSKRMWDSIRHMLFGDGCDVYRFRARWLTGGKQEITGPILPGNLTLMSALAGTPHFPSGAGKVVCLEDLNEEPYRIDFMLNHLLEAGLFRRARGVVFGWMPNCVPSEPRRSLSLDQVLRRFVAQVGLPTVAGLPFGHHVVNSILPVGGRLEIRANEATVRLPPRWSGRAV